MQGLQFFVVSRTNLWRLVSLRIFIVLVQALVLWGIAQLGLLPLPWAELAVALGLSTVWALLSLLRMAWDWPVTEPEYAAQLVMDILLQTLLLYYTGGAANPFVSYYLVPLSIAACVLSWRQTLLLGILALLAYSLLLQWNYQAPLGVDGEGHAGPLTIRLHLLGMWVNFAFSALLICAFTSRIVVALREQHTLQRVRHEDSLRNQHVLAIATQAAGAAHELGTPLSTMSVVLDEWLAQPEQPVMREDILLLQRQVHLCRDSLRHMIRRTESSVREVLSIAGWVSTVVERWTLMRPEVTYSLQIDSGTPPMLMPSADLDQALLNLLNNAADACPQAIQVRVNWSHEWQCVEIQDHGPGVPLEIAEQLGTPFVSSKGKGFGLGLFLSQTSVSRQGGRVELYNLEPGGTLATLSLPRSMRMTEE